MCKYDFSCSTIYCLSRLLIPERHFRSWPTVILVTSLSMSPCLMILCNGQGPQPSDRLMSGLVATFQWSPVSRLLGLISADNQMSSSSVITIIMPGQLPITSIRVSWYHCLECPWLSPLINLSDNCLPLSPPFLPTSTLLLCPTGWSNL